MTKPTVVINGEAVHDTDPTEHAANVTGKNPRFLAERVYVGIRSRSGRVEFRNPEVKEPPPDR